MTETAPPKKKSNGKPAAQTAAQKKNDETYFESLLRSAADMIIALDAQGLIRYASPSVERILGYKPRGAIGKSFLAWIHPDDLPAAQEAFASRRAAPGVAPAPLQVRGRHKDGSWRVIEALGTNLLDDPAVGALILNARDVTERVQNERRLSIHRTVTLALSEADTLAEAMPKILQAVCEGLDWKRGECWSAHWSMDKETMRLHCVESCQISQGESPQFKTITSEIKFEPGEGLPGRVFASGKPEWTPDIAKDGFARVAQALKAGYRAAFAFPVKVGSETLGVMTFLDGKVRPPDEGQLQVMESIGHQIGQFVERKRAVDALKGSEERYRDLVENTRDLICTHDLEGQLLSVNRAAAEGIGYLPEELIGRNLQEFLAPDVRKQFDAYLVEIRETGISSGVIKIRTKNGGERLWEYRNTLRAQGMAVPIVRGFAHDVTERVRASQALKKSEERFRALIEHSADAIALLDRGGKLRRFQSSAAGHILGYKMEENEGRDMLELIHPDDRERVAAQLIRLMKEPGSLLTEELCLRHKDGSWRWVEATAANLLEEAAVNAVVVNYRDITARKQAADALKVSESRFRALIENSSDEISIVDAEANLLYESPSANPLLGYQPGEFLGQSLFSLIHPDDQERVQNKLAQMIADPATQPRDEFRLRRRDGNWVWVEAVGTNLLGDPAARGIVINYHDITERKAAADALKDSEERYRAVIEQASEGIVLYELESRRVIESNSAYRAMLGYTAEEMSRLTLYDIVAHPRENVDQFTEEIKSRGKFWIGERRHRRKDGSLLDVEVGSSLIMFGGKQVMSVIVRDITERKRAEDKIAQSLREITTLRDIGQSLDADISFGSVARAALDGAREAMQADLALFFRMGEKGLEFAGVSPQDSPHHATAPIVRVGECLCGLSARQKKPIYSLDIHTDLRCDLFECKKAGVRSFASLPLLSEGEVIGVLNVASYAERDFQTQALFLEAIALTVSISLRNALLHEKTLRHAAELEKEVTERKQAELELRQRTDDLALIAALNDAANRGEDIESITDEFAQLARAAFNSRDAAVYLLTPDEQQIVMSSCSLSVTLREGIAKLIGHPIPKVQIRFGENSYFRKILGSEGGIITSDPQTLQKWIAEFAETAFLPNTLRGAVRKLIPQIFKMLDIASTISIPLVSSGRAVGILDISSGRQFTEEDLRRIRPIAQQMTAILLRKRTEQGLKESEERFVGAFNSSPAGIAITTIEDGRILDVNPALLQIFGYERDEVVGKRPRDINLWGSPIEREKINAALERDGRVSNLEIQVHAKSGALRDMLVSSEPVALGSESCLLSVFHDITDVRRAEQEARLLQTIALGVGGARDLDETVANILRLVCEATGWVVGEAWIPGADGSRLTLHPAWFSSEPGMEKFHEASTAFTFEPGVGLPGRAWQSHQAVWVEDVTQDPNFPRAEFARQAGLKTGMGVPVLGTEEARQAGLHAGVSIPVIANGQVTLVLDFFLKEARLQDPRLVELISAIAAELGVVIERKRAGEEMRKAEEKYRALVEDSPNVLYMDKADEDSACVYISPQVETLLGYSPADFENEPLLWHKVVDPRNYEIAARSIRETLERGKSDAEYRMIARDGRAVWVHDMSVLVNDAGGNPQFLQGFLVDITERKEAEAAERDQRILAEALRDTSETLGGSLDYGTVLDRILDIAGRVVPHDSSTILLIEAGRLKLARARGYGETSAKRIESEVSLLSLEEPGNLRQMFETRQPALIPDIAASPHWKHLPGTEWLRSSVGAPMIVQDEVIGFVLLDGRKPGMFTALHAERLQAFANQAAIAIHNARLYQQTREELAARKAAEEKLSASESELRALFAAMHDVVLTIDRDGVYRKIAPTNPDLLIRPPAELLGKSLRDVFPPEQAREFLDATRRAIETRQPVRIEYELPIEERRLWFSAHITAMDEANAVWVARDITERKQAEDALRKLSSAVEQTADMVFITDPDGIIEYVNPAFEQLTGYTLEEARGNTPRLLKSGLQDEAYYAKLWQTIKAGEVFRAEAVNRRKNGELYIVEQTITPIRDEGGNVSHFVSNCKDVTARKEAEEALREAERFARSTLNALTSNIAVLDESGTIIAVNRAWLEFAEANGGDPQNTGVGMNYLAVCDSAAGKDSLFGVDMAACIRSVLRGEQETYELEYPCHSPTEQRWFVARISRFEAGGPARVVVSHGNVTKRKLAETSLRSRVIELEAISKIAASLRAAQTLEEMLPLLLEETLTALDSTAGSISLYREESGELYKAAARGWLSDLPDTLIKPGMGIMGTVFSSGELHISREFASDPLLLPASAASVPPGWGGACIPLRAAAEVIGTMFISMPLPREFSSEEVKLLVSISEIAGTAIHRLNLNEETRRRLKQLQTLHTIDRAITGTQNLKVVFGVLLSEARATLGVDALCLLLLDPSTQRLRWHAAQGFKNRAIEKSDLLLSEGHAGRAAHERRVIRVSDLKENDADFLRAGLLADEGFTGYIAAPLTAKGQVKGVLEIFHRAPLTPNPDWFEFLAMLTEQAAIAIDNAGMFEDLQRANFELGMAYNATIEGWSRAMDLRDEETEGHTRRVTELTMKLCRAAGFREEDLIHARRGALLHDIGKMGVPDSILLKPDTLTDEEWEMMRRHPQFAYDMLAPISHLNPALDIPYCHHEKWDGSGYPRGLKGEEIPFAARLFAVADVWDALTSDRPYREAWSKENALAYIRKSAGTHFDPRAVEIFMKEIEGSQRS